MNEFLNEDENILFAIPKNVFYLPSLTQKFCNAFLNYYELKEFNEDVIYKDPKIQSKNLIIFKSKEDFCYSMLKFYLTAYSTDRIKNPELRESFNSIIFNFVNSQYHQYILNSSSLIEYFVKGILIDIDKYFLSQMATANILRLVERFSLTDIKSRENRNSVSLENFEKFSYDKSKIFENLCGKIFTNLNKYMSDFMQEITNTYNILYTSNNNTNSLINTINKKDAIKKFISYSIIFSEYIVLLEILIKINSSLFLDQRNLLFTNLLNFLTNISTRLTNSNSHKKIKDILSYNVDNTNLNQPKINAQATLMNDVFRSLGYPIISIFNDLNSAKAFSEENEFSKQLSLSDFIDFENFKNILDDLKESDLTKQNTLDINNKSDKNKISMIIDYPKSEIENDLDKYKDTINMLIEKKKLKAHLNYNDDDRKSKIDNEKLCFICFTRNMDTILSPCNHGIF